jgi:adenylylsulfate kinase
VHRVVWLTGLSGAGKTTIANQLAVQLNQCGLNAQVLDGDTLRQGLCTDLGFEAADRTENVRRAAHVARLLAEAGAVVIVALITPLEAMRDLVRTLIPDRLEVFVDAPLSICEQRDPKGLYKKARSGEIRSFTGLDSPYERPASPDVICLTSQETVAVSVAKVMARVIDNRKVDQGVTFERRKTIAVDFDGVIADYNGWAGSDDLGSPRQDVVEALGQLQTEGWKIVVHTTRGAPEVRAYLLRNEIPFEEINQNSDYVCGGQKPVATVYWDDRAIRYSGNALNDLERIRNFRTWNDRV